MQRLLILSACFLSLAACGDDGASSATDAAPPPDATAYDAAPPDANIPVCSLTECGTECIDTTSDTANCGGCGMACDSPGQICSGTLPCACPEPYLPSDIGGSPADTVQMQGPFYIAASPVTFSPINALLVAYDLTLETGMDYDLTGAALAAPLVLAGYDINITDQSAHTYYGATAGTVNFSQICATGVSGTMANLVLSEVGGITSPTPVAGGCSMSYDALTFDIGTCPQI